MRPFILKETSWKTIKTTDYSLAVIPWGATEAHNYHLPYGTDTYEADAICDEAARLTWEKGSKIIVLPAIPFGVNTGQLDIPFDINIMPSTQMAILHDIVENLARHNINKILLVNSHGGNNFKPLIREVNASFPSTIIALAEWFKALPKEDFFDAPGDHADEMETSLMVYCYPELVHPLTDAGEGRFRKFIVKELNEGWAWTERRWTQVTADTGIGNPKKATGDKGKVYFKAVTEKLSGLMIALAETDPDKMYE